MADKKATRESYGAALAALGEKYDFLVLDADLAAATKTGVFKKKFPDRFFDCGIAEGNMISVAAGIAATGRTVFASSFAMFAAGRAFEQVRNSVGYPHLNVKIGATHGGITVGEDGATHQSNEDFALMRTIPGMTVMCPADAVEVAKCAADYGTYIELNSKKTHLTDEELNEIVAKTDARFIIDSDAHSKDRVGDKRLVEEQLARLNFPMERIANIDGRTPVFRFAAYKKGM